MISISKMGILLERETCGNQAVDHSPPTNRPTRMLSWIGYGIGSLYIHLHSISVVATRQKTNSREKGGGRKLKWK